MLPSGRNDARSLLGLFKFSQVRSLVTTAACLSVATLVAFGPQYPGLSEAGHRALFVLLFAAGMWITEAIPAFATSLLTIGCLIALLGKPDGVYATDAHDWEQFVTPWGSPLIWLFFGGFCLATSAEKTGLDRWLAARALGLFGQRPAMLLLGLMLVTAVLSMFMSNTATATLVLAMMTPIFAARAAGDPVSKAIALGVAFAANIGGMGTIIGTPPNAIAAGLLQGESAVNFAEWMILGVPPSLVLLAISWIFLVVVHLRGAAFSSEQGILFHAGVASDPTPLYKQQVVVATFCVTVGLWMTSPLHGLPTTLVSFVPTVVLTSTGILTAADIRQLPWDILLLITGGLSLGVAIDNTGLAEWAVGLLPIDGLSPVALAIGFSYITLVMSNLMSNTAAANIVLPIAIAVLGAAQAAGGDARMAAPIALSASAAMCLPISTPPNAIVYGAGHLRVKEMVIGGVVIGLIAPPILVFWSAFAIGWL
ncbi:Sodium-dependent dicarboxylate transporter SdcS [Botrimarina colliarenosi]|uniref:Sodium-dependent dicarboxylate transporter SdcS n=1 Tax=Botrimarina colliarenosi TaxID=2528001 RepID=A0A5C6A7D3_9BACT|nr:DASS family sodium-coupled anion symporter [Botrimarina colliarenosi]TWT95198.1 Sodium-dependent dicarboxylate transporter SdcS [Botrimarina colliarenosi]